MTTIINAVAGTGITQSADGSGQIKIQSNGVTTNALAWVNFNGGNGNTAGVVNSSYNVSSVTAVTTGTFKVNLTNAMSDANYSVVGSIYTNATSDAYFMVGYPNATGYPPTTTYFYCGTKWSGVANIAVTGINIAVFGN